VTPKAIPTVSVCIPTYNQIDYLKLTLDSVFEQEGVDYEVVISDDSSNDRVFEFIKKYSDYQKKIRYFRNNPSLGSPENWNFAIRQAKGQYVKVLHHDDRFTSKDSLKKFVSILEKEPNIFLAFCGSKATNANGKFLLNRINDNTFNQILTDPTFLFRANLIGAPSAVIFKSEQVPLFDNRLKWLVDLEFYYRCLIMGKKFSYSPEVLVETFSPQQRVTNTCLNNPDVEIFENLYFLEKHKIKSYRNLNHVVELFLRFKISRIRDLRNLGWHSNPPILLILILYIKSSFFYKFYSVVLARFSKMNTKKSSFVQ
jgi:glycosyltransferase involved in cell wall biosynthesis